MADMERAAPAAVGWARRLFRPASHHVTPDFEALLGPEAWGRLPAAVRARFAAHPGPVETLYPGEMAVRASSAGLWLARLSRLIGTPLAPHVGEAVPVTVSVRKDIRGAMVWDRLYAFPGRAPVLVSSRKRMLGRDLVEVVSCGLGMVLDLSVEDGALHFRSRRYFWKLGALRLPVPCMLTPGRAHVVHADAGGGAFRFTLSFTHPWLGRTLYQDGLFRDPE